MSDFLNRRDRRAVEWAASNAANSILIDGTGNPINETIRRDLRRIIVLGLDNDHSREYIALALEQFYGFDPRRAKIVADSEVRTAEGHGSLMGYVSAGMKFKAWLLSNDVGVCAACAANAAQGYIPIDQPFPSGHQAPLAHDGCRCDIVGRLEA